jgi:hypothetical protein
VKPINAPDPAVAANAFTVPSFGVLPRAGVVPNLHTEDIAKSLGSVIRQEIAKDWIDRRSTMPRFAS